jgi:putative ABC transport system ATP-binding protein
MTAFENVELPMILDGELNEIERKTRAIELLKTVGLGDRLDHLPSELSGGEQQRVAIARALSNKPDILLLDEPTGDLDSRSTVQVMDLLLEINRLGPNRKGPEHSTTCVMVTHNPELECYADRILYV